MLTYAGTSFGPCIGQAGLESASSCPSVGANMKNKIRLSEEEMTEELDIDISSVNGWATVFLKLTFSRAIQEVVEVSETRHVCYQ